MKTKHGLYNISNAVSNIEAPILIFQVHTRALDKTLVKNESYQIIVSIYRKSSDKHLRGILPILTMPINET